MKISRLLLSAALPLIGVAATCGESFEFADNFNRANSASAGNGWSDAVGNIGGNLAIVSNKLSAPASTAAGAMGGIYRPAPFDRPLRVEVTLTDSNNTETGANRHYRHRIGIRSAGGLDDGYFVAVERTDSTASDSRVSLYDGETLLGTVNSEGIQFAEAVTLKVFFFPDGQVRGEIEQSDGDTHFSFGRHTIHAAGSQFSLAMDYGTTRRATADVLELEAVGASAPPVVLWELQSATRLATPPALGDDGTFFAAGGATTSTSTGAVAFNSKTGAALWGPKFVLSGITRFGAYGISVGGTGLVHGTSDATTTQRGTLAALNPGDGSTAWSRNHGAGVSPNPRQTPPVDDDNDSVFFGSDQIGSFTRAAGTQEWVNKNGLTIGGRGGVIDASGNITYATASSTQVKIVSLTKDGVLRWTRTFSSGRSPRPRAVLADGRVLAYDSGNNRLYCWNATTGADVWFVSNLDRPVTDAAGNIYAGEADGRGVVSLTAAGAERWRIELPDVDLTNGGERASVAFIDSTGHLYVTFTEHLYCLNTGDGSTAWLFDALNVLSQPADNDGVGTAPRLAHGGRLFLTDSSNRWYQLDTHLEYAPSSWPVAVYANRRHTCKAGQILDVPGENLPPTVATLDVANATATTIQLGGRANPRGATASVWFEYGTQPNLGTATTIQTLASGNADVNFNATLTGLLGNTTYYWRAVASNAAGTVYGDTKQFTMPVFEPLVETRPATAITVETATLNALANANGSATTVKFQYGPSTSYDHTTPSIDIGADFGMQPVSFPIAELLPGTTYHFRALSTNAQGTAIGADLSFTTQALPPVIGEVSANLISGTAARLRALVNPNRTVTNVTFQLGTSIGYGRSFGPYAIAAGAAEIEVTVLVASLVPATLHHFRIIAVNTGGTTTGGDNTFTTAPALAIAVTSPAVGATVDVPGTLHLSATTAGGGATVTGVEFFVDGESVGGDLDAPFVLDVPAPAAGPHTVSASAINSAGETAASAVVNFTTRQIPVPEVATGSASDIALGSATLHGTVVSGLVPAAVFFQYGLTTAYGSATAATSAPAGGAVQPFAHGAAGLARGATYHFRAAASNAAATVFGDDRTFTTLPNNVPAAGDDSAYAVGIVTITIPVLANDTDADADTLTVASVAPPANATVTINADGTLTWKAKSTYTGLSTFTYVVADGFGGTDTATVTVRNPFAVAAGLYYGRISGTPAVAENNGSLKITIGTGGAFTGKMFFASFGSDASGYTIKGTLAADGHATFTATAVSAPSLPVELFCDFTADPIRVTGRVTVPGLTGPASGGDIDAERIPWNATTNKAPFAGTYTLLLPAPESRVPGQPRGHGFGRMTVGANGSISLIGRVADSLDYTIAAYVHADGRLPLYIGLYTRPSGTPPPYGAFFGDLFFRDTPESDADGAFDWIKPARPGESFPAGFHLPQPVIASRYIAPPEGTYLIAPTVPGPQNGDVHLAHADYTTPVTRPVTLNPMTVGSTELLKIPVVGANPESFDLAFIPHAGYLSATVKRPDGVRVAIRGIAFQKQRRAAGHYLGKTEPGLIEIIAR